ncbi:MAG: porin PorA family protein [Candidatus Nitrosopumilus sp. bin_7KS]
MQIFIIAIIAGTAITYWNLIEIPKQEKFSDTYLMEREYEGQNQVVDDVYGELSQPFLLKDSLQQNIIEKNGDALTISSIVSSKIAATNEILFIVEHIYKVDAKTRMHLDRDGKLFSFPLGVEKKDYDFFHPAVFMNDPMVYKETTTLYDLEVYVFEVVSENEDVSFAFPQFAPHTIHTDTTSRLWVEPTTGNVISFEKTWENYLVENGQRVNTIEIGGKKTSEYTDHIVVKATTEQIQNIHFNHVMVPIFLVSLILIAGLVCIFLTFSNKIRKDRSQLKEKEKLRDELISMVSHEIRNPLTPIISMCDLLLLEKDGNLNNKQRERIQTILKNSTTLNELLSDFTEIKKLDLNQIPLIKTEIDLKDYLETVLESVRPFAAEKNIKLKLDLEKSWKIICNPKRISQVISNLVKNATDFVPQGKGEIVISAKLTREGTIISVTDNGIGIPPSKSEIIFDKFTQLDIPSYIQHEGTGLGLSICKGIIDAHDGRIWLDKTYDAGARFQFLLP